jgi:holo-[acyl-carrier protein] synthase
MRESADTQLIGHGIEIVETTRIQELVEQSGKQFEMECFTATERSTPALGAKRIEYLAGRFAAKEAILKALGIGNNPNISKLDIEIQRLPSGKPSVVLRGKCQEIAEELGIKQWLLSISHTSSYAAASAIALGAVPEAIAWRYPEEAIALKGSNQKPNPLASSLKLRFPAREGGTRTPLSS